MKGATEGATIRGLPTKKKKKQKKKHTTTHNKKKKIKKQKNKKTRRGGGENEGPIWAVGGNLLIRTKAQAIPQPATSHSTFAESPKGKKRGLKLPASNSRERRIKL